MPFVWIPNNQTSYVKWEAIPRNWRSKAFQTQGPNSVKKISHPAYWLKLFIHEHASQIFKDDFEQMIFY